MNERQARRAVMLADERQAILRDLAALTDPDRVFAEGLGLVIVTKDRLPIGASIDGVVEPWPHMPSATRLTARIPRPAFNAALQAMVTASQDRAAAIDAELLALGVEP